MNFFHNNNGFCGQNDCRGGFAPNSCGFDPCILILLLLCSGCGNSCSIDCCSLILIMLLLSMCGCSSNCGGDCGR